MNLTARTILILALGAWLCAACQGSATPSPGTPIPSPSDQTLTSEPAPPPTTEPTPTTASEPSPAPQLDPEVEEYAVYAALLESEFTGGDTEQILIVDHTQVNNPGLLERDLAEFQKVVPLPPELVASFKERNQEPHPLEPVLDLAVEYQLMTQEEIDELRPLDEASGWKLFYEKYPQTVGFIYLSRVGFNADLSQALVYVSHYRYEQPIQGGYYLLSKQDGRWVVGEGYIWQT